MKFLEEILRFLVQGLVEKPDEIKITTVESDRATILQLQVNADDLGRVIGKNGRIAKALRTVIKAAATRRGERVIVEILD